MVEQSTMPSTTRQRSMIQSTAVFLLLVVCLQQSTALVTLHSPYSLEQPRHVSWRTSTVHTRQGSTLLSAINGRPPRVVCLEETAVAEAKATELALTTANDENDSSSQRDSSIRNLPMEGVSMDDPTLAMAPPPREKYTILALLWAIAILSALDRVAMSVALVPMTEQLGYTDSIKGSISSFFSVGYGLCIVPTGLLIATASTRLVMAGGLMIWSLATIATPEAALWVDSMTPLLICRSLVGAGESVIMPSLQRFLAAWTAPEEKSVAFATIYAGFQFGTIAAYLLSPWVMDSFGGWRDLFYIYGLGGMIILVPWLLFAKDSPDQPQVALPSTSLADQGVTPKTENTIGFQDALDNLKNAPWKDFVQSKGAWAMLLAHCSKNWGLYNTLAWTPTFYYEQYGIGVRDSAWLAVLPSIAGAVGGLIAGNCADSLVRNLPERTDEGLTRIRKIFQSIALYGPATSLAILSSHIPEDPVVAQFFLMAAVGLQASTVAGFEAANQEKSGPKWAGLLYSITSLPAVMFATFGVYVSGQILDATDQNWSLVFGLNAFVNILGATAFVLLYDSKREFD